MSVIDHPSPACSDLPEWLPDDGPSSHMPPMLKEPLITSLAAAVGGAGAGAGGFKAWLRFRSAGADRVQALSLTLLETLRAEVVRQEEVISGLQTTQQKQGVALRECEASREIEAARAALAAERQQIVVDGLKNEVDRLTITVRDLTGQVAGLAQPPI